MKKCSSFLFALALSTMLSANNIAVSNMQLTGKNTTGHFLLVQFDLSWENSFRVSTGPANLDAAWVFIKYRVAVSSGGDGAWRHAALNATGHTAPAGSAITPASDGTGAFIYRSVDGTGNFNVTGVQLRWNYGANYKSGATLVGDGDLTDIHIYAIEMVNVPAGNFYVGSGGTETGSLTAANITSGSTVPFLITSTAPTLQGNNTGSSTSNLSAIYSFGWDLTGTATASLATGFPTGYAAFYCMKYEISQQGFVDFLNSLTYTQQATRTVDALQPNPPNSTPGTYLYNTNRNKIKIGTSGVDGTIPAIYTTDYPYVACNNMSWDDVAAYLDWSGLRPMSELEFEKACRGALAPVPNEYGWGTPGIDGGTAYLLSNGGAINETIGSNYSTTVGNASYNTTDGEINGPLRVGIFSGSAGNNGRVTAGATYYGIMEMSGNVWERLVTVGNATGRSFTGTHGDGTLNSAGDQNVTGWPGTDGEGAGLRGGFWNGDAGKLQVSNRWSAATSSKDRNKGNGGLGGRGVRSAP
jgi:formylglycine-generating enzyme required for sulfatase activity